MLDGGDAKSLDHEVLDHEDAKDREGTKREGGEIRNVSRQVTAPSRPSRLFVFFVVQTPSQRDHPAAGLPAAGWFIAASRFSRWLLRLDYRELDIGHVVFGCYAFVACAAQVDLAVGAYDPVAVG